MNGIRWMVTLLCLLSGASQAATLKGTFEGIATGTQGPTEFVMPVNGWFVIPQPEPVHLVTSDGQQATYMVYLDEHRGEVAVTLGTTTYGYANTQTGALIRLDDTPAGQSVEWSGGGFPMYYAVLHISGQDGSLFSSVDPAVFNPAPAGFFDAWLEITTGYDYITANIAITQIGWVGYAVPVPGTPLLLTIAAGGWALLRRSGGMC